jgi:hypothetical protein
MSTTDRSIYQVRDVHFSYKMGALRVTTLSGIALDTERGAFVSLSGLSHLPSFVFQRSLRTDGETRGRTT